MKFIKSKCLQKAKGTKKGKYLITLEVSDYDLDMLEDLTQTYEPFQLWDDCKSDKITMDEFHTDCTKCDYSEKYRKWLNIVFHEFCRLWRIYDE